MKTTTNDSRCITINRFTFQENPVYTRLEVYYINQQGETTHFPLLQGEHNNLGDGELTQSIPISNREKTCPNADGPVLLTLHAYFSEEEYRTFEMSLDSINPDEGWLCWRFTDEEDGMRYQNIGNYNAEDIHLALTLQEDGGILIIGDCDMDPAPKLNVYAVRNGVQEGQFAELIYGNDSPNGETRFKAIPSETAIHIESRPLPIIGQHPQATARGFDPVEITVLAKQTDGGLAVSKFRCYWLIRRQGSSAFIDLEFWYYLDGDLRTRQRVKRITCMDLFYQFVEIVLDHDGEAFRIKDLNLIEKFT